MADNASKDGAPPTESSNGSESSRKPAGRPTHPLPSDRISFENQLNILRAYAAASGPERQAVTIADAGRLANITAGTLTLNNGFFTGVGLLTKTDDGFVPSDEVMSFHRAYSWGPEEAPRKLAPALRTSWFAQALLPHLAMRAMPEDEAVKKLAEECHADPKYSNRLATLIDYLAAADIVTRENSTIREGPLARDEGRQAPVTPSRHVAKSEPEPSKAKPQDTAVATMFAKPTGGALQFHVDIRVDMAEMEHWKADRIAAFFSGIAKVLAAKQGIEEKEAELQM